MNLYLLSSPGVTFLSDVLSAARELTAGQQKPVVAYLPAGLLTMSYLLETKTAFESIAQVISINLETDSLEEIQSALERATLLYIPGGNTYLAAYRLHARGASEMGAIYPRRASKTRLHTRGVSELLRERLQAGLPLVAFSAGAVLCGQDVLTSGDLNACGCVTFAGLGLAAFDFSVHFPTDTAGQDERDVWLRDYHAFHETPILAMEDGAALRVTGQGAQVLRGNVWKLAKRKMRERVDGMV